MFFPEGISTLQQTSLTWHCLKGLLKVMQLITWVVITALLLRCLKWFIIDSLILESAEYLHTQPWTRRQGPVQAPESPGILGSPSDAPALHPSSTGCNATTVRGPDPAAGTVASPGYSEH